MKARLLCRTGELSGASFEIGDEATVGRGTDNTIVLFPKVISQTHARITFDPRLNRYVLEDLGSRNGTQVDGLPVEGAVRLGPLHVITFGNRHDFIFQALSGSMTGATSTSTPQAAAPADTQIDAQPQIRVPQGLGEPREGDAAPVSGRSDTQIDAQREIQVPQGLGTPQGSEAGARTSVEAAGAFQVPEGLEAPKDPAHATRADVTAPRLPTALRPSAEGEAAPNAQEAKASGTRFLFHVDGAQGRRTVELEAGRRIVGRSPVCDLVLAERTLSREHAVFTLHPGRVLVLDLGSQNGTFVGGKRITAETEVTPGTTVTLGDVQVVFERETD